MGSNGWRLFVKARLPETEAASRHNQTTTQKKTEQKTPALALYPLL
jgi:hypothetical protein